LSWEQLLPELMATLPGMPLVLGVTQLSALQFAKPVDQGGIRALDFVPTARIRVNRSFDEYWMARDSSLRHQIERRLRRLRDEGIEPRLEVITGPSEISGAIGEFGRLESSGWKGRLGTAVHIDNAQGIFYRRLLQDFCARGKAAVYRYRFNDATVAMELCLQGGGTLIMLKTAYDEAYKGFAPGILMRRAIFEHVFSARQVTVIDFLGKLQSWQTKWLDDIYPLYHINSYRWPWLAGVSNLFQGWRRRPISMVPAADGK
jgi:hypothetical protein